MWATLSVEGEFAVHDGVPALEDLQSAVGGDVEVLGFVDFDMWLNEEGKLVGLPSNDPATKVAHDQLMIGTGDYIAGNVAFTGGVDDEGDTVGLTDYQLEIARRVAGTQRVAFGVNVPTGPGEIYF